MILDFLVKDVFQHLVVDRVKEFSHIAFEGIALVGVVLAHRTKHTRNFLDAFMCAFVDPARIRIINKCRLEYFIQHSKSGVMKYAVSDDRFMYPSEFRIMYPKSFVWPMPIRLILQVAIQVKDILFNVKFKLRNIRFVPFIRLEYLPSSE
ncbi:MAG: hypothetical protein ACOYMZ_03745 [Minisyncoccia bacterium]